MIYKVYGRIHKIAKKVLKRNYLDINDSDFVNFTDEDFDEEGFLIKPINVELCYVNELTYTKEVKKEQVYPVENIVKKTDSIYFKKSFQKSKKKKSYCKTVEEATKLWGEFIEKSVIAKGYRNEGLSYAGYISEYENWCLPSWIWTNAAIVRYYCNIGNKEKAYNIGEKLLLLQERCGGWIVRNDYERGSVIPQLAPNDSAYIANNACLTLYETFNDDRFLASAEKCAEWIMSTARSDGFVYLGYDTLRNKWIKDKNIVDTGFTAGLFANLYRITKKEEYLVFLQGFINKYIELFYDSKKKRFWTAINENDEPLGGNFGRGQAWALEGLIPAYEVLKTDYLKNIIDDTVHTLLSTQNKHGGWPYNFKKILMGEDCKCVPVIAASLLRWSNNYVNNNEIKEAVEKSLEWCVRHTYSEGIAAGGIFEYSLEGSVVHHLYTSTAFVYSSVYALEIYNALNENGGE